MFDTMKTAGKIRESRIAMNMTQMNLADAMEVSFQAISNWERGNSMPDIAKLEQLCGILHISMEELLGADQSRTVRKVMAAEREDGISGNDDHPVSMDEIKDLAPILPPDKVGALAEEYLKQNPDEKIDFAAVMGLAPFLDKKYLDALARNAQINSLYEWTGLTPFLSDKVLDELVLAADVEVNVPGIAALAPFLSEETLDKLFQQIPEGEHENISGLLPFLSRKTLQDYAEKLMKENNLDALKAVMPFL